MSTRKPQLTIVNNALPSNSDAMIGRVIGERYTVLSAISRGGMGAVYRAQQHSLSRVVALKVLEPWKAWDDMEAVHERFAFEAKVSASLNHPNTITVYDYGIEPDGMSWIAMEYIHGATLRTLIRRMGALTPSQVIDIGVQVCRGLGALHERDIVHRDLKPANIMVTCQGGYEEQVKVLDFGLAKHFQSDSSLTGHGKVVGSPKVMSPEQIEGRRLDARSDIYSLGMNLYMALTAKSPYVRDTPMAVLLAQLSDPLPTFAEVAPDVKVAPALEAIVRRCLAKDREDRYASTFQLEAALLACMTEVTDAALPSPLLQHIEAEERSLPVSRRVASADDNTTPFEFPEPRRARKKIATVDAEECEDELSLSLDWPSPRKRLKRTLTTLGMVAFAFCSVLAGTGFGITVADAWLNQQTDAPEVALYE